MKSVLAARGGEHTVTIIQVCPKSNIKKDFISDKNNVFKDIQLVGIVYFKWIHGKNITKSFMLNLFFG